MAYHGYLSLIKHRLLQIKHPPRLLEVGVDRGVSFLTLTMFLARTRPEFLTIGIDVNVQEQVNIMLANIDLQPKQMAYLLEENSLSALPKMVDQGMKFDVVLLDGDHNYHTVSTELALMDDIIEGDGVIIVDDYDGRWSDRDLWYAERDGYSENKIVTKRVDTDKYGVKPAVDEWLASHQSWNAAKPIDGEPIMLTKAGINHE